LLSNWGRSASLEAVHAKTLNSGGGVLSPTIVVEARAVGTWKHTFRKDTVVVTVSPFASLSEVQNRALNTAVERYSKFVGMSATVITSKT